MSHHKHHRPPPRLGGRPNNTKIIFEKHTRPVWLFCVLAVIFFCIFFFGADVHPGGY